MTREISINSEVAEKALSEFSAPSLDYGINFSGATAMADVSDSVLIQAEQIAAASDVQLVLNQDLIAAAPEFKVR